MKRLLVFQHVPHEILGIFHPLLKTAGFRIRYINFGRTPDAVPDVSRYDGLIVLGGPMCLSRSGSHPHLYVEVDAIRAAMEQHMPVFGICLGAQLIAAALGARVHRNPVKEIGWYDVEPTHEAKSDPLFSKFVAHEKIFQWHGDTFELPVGATHLARSELCTNQAFRFGDRTYGLQFHLEVDEPMIGRWLKTRDNQRELEDLAPEITAERIAAETPLHIGRSQQLGEEIFGEFISLFSSRTRRVVLPSR